MKRTILFCIAALFLMNVQAKRVEPQTAQTVGISYYCEHVNQFIPTDFKGIEITGTYTETFGDLPLYYVFNINKNGFVIVSGDDNMTPVIGYSYESNFDASNIPENLQYWLSEVKRNIEFVLQNNVMASTEIAASWNYYKSRNENNINLAKSKVVAPLMTSTWGQGKFYNYYCPTATGGPDDKAVVGCVATAMSMIMYYYRYPAMGLGTHGVVNYGTTTYNWDNMLESLGNYNNPVALLCYHCGISVNMNYAADGSGAMTQSVPNAAKSHFRYDNSCTYTDYSGSYNATTWANLLKSNLDANHPLEYSGSDPVGGGHAWNCDGYDASNNFHMNWGWDGSANGYFAISNLSAGGYTFSQSHGVVYNFFPPTASYPSNCTGTKTVTYTTGTIEDGSGSSNYQNNNDCMWLISPTETVTKITLTFLTMATEATNDIVTVYDGSTTSAPVLGIYSGSTLPASIVSTGPTMLVRFQTNGSVVAQGWKATYRSTFPAYCSGMVTLTTPSGTVADGSGTDNYSYNYLCRWIISPPNAGSITINFTAINVGTGDFVKIYDGVTNAELANYTGTTIPASATYTTSKIMVLFKSDGYVNAPGFSLDYTSEASGIGISENSNLIGLSIYPNPTKEVLNIHFLANNSENLRVEMNTISGVAVYSEILSNFSGNYNKTIETSTLAQGVYLLRIIGDKQTVCKKIVIE